MHEFKIYANSQGAKEAVKQGWSWPAFFFNLIWAFVKGMWALGIGLFILFVVLGVIEGMLEVSSGKAAAQGMSAFSSILQFIIAITFGINGNEWREKKLQSLGYGYKNTISAATPEGAIDLWIK